MDQFTLFNSPIDLASWFFQKHLSPSDLVIDATVGHGFDAHKALSFIPDGFLYGFDVQQAAIDSSDARLKTAYHNYKLFKTSHERFPPEIKKNSISLIIYNLGYLPKGDKSLTTKVDSTLKSLNAGLDLLKPGGVMSIMCYCGHEEGAKEKDHVIKWMGDLDKTNFLASSHELINRDKAPLLCLVQKKIKLSPYE